MRELLAKANAGNPLARQVCGFQPAFCAEYSDMVEVTNGIENADILDMIYESTSTEVYIAVTKEREGGVTLFNVKLIAALRNYEHWLVVQGLIAVNRKEQMKTHIRQGKKMLVKAMEDIWGIEFSKEVKRNDVCA